ncbi:MAG: hypothetical protein AAFR73_12510 [Pseudomonadota bacterium]
MPRENVPHHRVNLVRLRRFGQVDRIASLESRFYFIWYSPADRSHRQKDQRAT